MLLDSITAIDGTPAAVSHVFTKVDKRDNVVFLRSPQTATPYAGHAHQDITLSVSSVIVADGGRRYTVKLAVPHLISEDGDVTYNREAVIMHASATIKTSGESKALDRKTLMTYFTKLLSDSQLMDAVEGNEGIY